MTIGINQANLTFKSFIKLYITIYITSFTSAKTVKEVISFKSYVVHTSETNESKLMSFLPRIRQYDFPINISVIIQTVVKLYANMPVIIKMLLYTNQFRLTLKPR